MKLTGAELEAFLKKISIRGRMALGISCLEIAIKELGLSDDNAFECLCSDLWEFVSANNKNWEEKINRYYPVVLVKNMDWGQINIDKFLSTNKEQESDAICQEMAALFEELIDQVIYIGTSNLYGGTGEYSQWSLEPTLKVLSIMEQLHFRIPNLIPFSKSKFSEVHGWGKKRAPSFFE